MSRSSLLRIVSNSNSPQSTQFSTCTCEQSSRPFTEPNRSSRHREQNRSFQNREQSRPCQCESQRLGRSLERTTSFFTLGTLKQLGRIFYIDPSNIPSSTSTSCFLTFWQTCQHSKHSNTQNSYIARCLHVLRHGTHAAIRDGMGKCFGMLSAFSNFFHHRAS